MATRKPAKNVGAKTMPPELVWSQDNIRRFKDQIVGVPPEYVTSESGEWAWYEVQARKLFMAARAEFLVTLRERPEGVQNAEFIAAHGYAWPDREKARMAGLVF
jgi:hypothetical protein